jgi:hypothetical protein
MSELVRSIFVLMTDGRTIDGGLMLRVLYEHVVKFCWIAAEPATRYPIWRSDGLVQRRKLHHDAIPFGWTILDTQQLEEQAASAELPKMPQMAEQVDAYWGGRIDALRPRVKGEPLQLLTIRGMYIPAYRTLSEPVHGHADVMEAYINGGTAIWPVGTGAADRSIWWALTVTLFAQALLVCHTVLGDQFVAPEEPTNQLSPHAVRHSPGRVDSPQLASRYRVGQRRGGRLPRRSPVGDRVELELAVDVGEPPTRRVTLGVQRPDPQPAVARTADPAAAAERREAIARRLVQADERLASDMVVPFRRDDTGGREVSAITSIGLILALRVS